MKRTAGWIVGIFIMTVFGSYASAMDILVIANEGYPVQKIQPADLKKIYLGDKIFEGSMVIKPIDQADLNPIKKAFIEKVLFLTMDAYKGHWLKRVFREGAIPPTVQPSSREVIALAASAPEAVGYVWAEEVTGHPGIKVLLRVHLE